MSAPDLRAGQYVAYVTSVQGDLDTPATTILYAANPDLGSIDVLLDAAPPFLEAVSPDGLVVAYWVPSSPIHLSPIHFRDLLSGRDREVPGTLGCAWLSFSPDPERIVCSDGDVRVVDVVTGGSAQLNVCPPDVIEQGVICGGTLWSPDGRWIAYKRYRDRSGPAGPDEGIYIIDATCIPRPLTCQAAIQGPTGSARWGYSWAPDGSRLAAATVDGLSILDVMTRAWSQVPLTEEFPFITQVAWSPDGTVLAFVDAGSYLYVVDVGGGSPVEVDHGSYLSLLGWFVIE
jgi:Tol biopolymer transport system component